MPLDNRGEINRFNGHIINGANNNIGFVAQIVEITDPSGVGLGCHRTVVRTQDAQMMSAEMQCGYTEKAFMSFDGLFRPVSMDGEGGLPRYARCNSFDDCAGCTGSSPGAFTLTIAGTAANSGQPDINGDYTLTRTAQCTWELMQATDPMALEIEWGGTAWRLDIDGDTSDPTTGAQDCSTSITFVYTAGLTGYTGGTFVATPASQITIEDLQPWQNPQGNNWSKVPTDRSDTPTRGHDLDVVGRTGTAREDTPDGGLGMYQAGYKQDGATTPNCDSFDYRDDYRFLAHKGPMVLHGWGYDCDGNPVPNKNDTEAAASSGTFVSTGLDSEKFLDDHLRKPHTWPVGPVDLRWDHARCVWTASGCNTGTATTTTTSGSADCAALHSTFGVPDTNAVPPVIYMPVFGTDGSCDIVEVVQCGQDATPPCAGCNTTTPSYYLLQINGVALDGTNPAPSNSFDLGVGNEILMSRVSRCGFQTNLDYLDEFGATNTMTIDLQWNNGALEWQLTTTNPPLTFTGITGPYNCSAQHTFTYTGAANAVSGYDFTGATFTIIPRVTIL